jgi:uncharacterized coiled-coil protein SlyX
LSVGLPTSKTRTVETQSVEQNFPVPVPPFGGEERALFSPIRFPIRYLRELCFFFAPRHARCIEGIGNLQYAVTSQGRHQPYLGPPGAGGEVMDSSERNQGTQEYREGSGIGIWLGVAALVLVAIGIFAFASNRHQQQTISQLTSHASEMNSTISDLQNQLASVNSKMSDMQAAQSAAVASAAEAAKTANRTAARTGADPRWKKVQGQLDAEQKQLADEQSTMDQARADLQGAIASSHDELTGSIARTHDELVALEQRGERNYDEFDLTKGKNNRFFRVGPISLSLRKTDPKHSHYDLAMMVDDNQLQKKNVDLYEPIWLRDSDEPQPLEVVVNKIDKNHIHGYVSSPKFAQGQIKPASAAAGTPAPQTQDSNAPTPGSTPQTN